MLRFITPIILIGVAIASFYMFTNPLYKDLSGYRAQAASYNDALTNSKALENERDKLTAKYNAINPDDLMKIKKLLPDNVDNIRLILEIGQIASPYGMVLKNVKYDTVKEDNNAVAATPGKTQGNGTAPATRKDYGVWELEFSTEGTYNNFINFLRDMESNLRIVDVESITFSSDVGPKLIGFSLPDVYTYNFKIKTYWLKN